MNSSLEKDESGFKNENSDNIFIIEGLFNEYNFEINLDKRLNVLIGENGVGKSTILRIIRYLSELDFVGLSRYMFKKIILVRGENRFEINYTDLIPKPMYIISQFSEETMDWIDCLEFDLQVDLKAAYVKNEYFYSVFMSKCYFDEPIGGQILSFIPDNCLVSRRPGLNFTEEYKFSLEKLVRHSEKAKCFTGAKVMDQIDQIMEFFDNYIFSIKNVITLDLINNIKLIDDKIINPIAIAPSLDRLHSYILYEEANISDSNIVEKGFNRLVKIQTLKEEITNQLKPVIKALNENIEIELPTFTKMNKKSINTLNDDMSLDINSILTRYYYSDEFILMMNEKANRYITETLDIESPCGALDNKFFTHEVMYNIKTYIRPVIVESSLMGLLVDEILISYMMEDFIQARIEAFKKFYNENIEAFFVNKSNKIIQLEDIINSIYSGKRISVKPNGIDIIIDNYSRKSNNRFDLIINESNQIRAMDLSSGERKILIIILISLFLEHSILIIDEPELSISIMWQEKLLAILMDETLIEHVIVATHSPFIINEKIIEESVLVLPLEVIE